MGKKDRMKNGLASLFVDNSEHEEVSQQAEQAGGNGLQTVRLSLIEPDKKQPRKDFDEDKLSELADNITQMGVLQPLLVRPADADGRYTIVAGERRWRAARRAGLTEIPVIVREMSDKEAVQIALIENIQREDLNPIEEARAYKRLSADFGMTQEEIGKAVGKPRSVIANAVRLLELPDEAIAAVQERKLSVGHAKVLCGVQSRERQLVLLDEVIKNGLTVRSLEQLAESAVDKSPAKKERRKKAADKEQVRLTEYGLAIRNEYGVLPEFKKKANGAVVMNISFRSEEELSEFIKKLSRQG